MLLNPVGYNSYGANNTITKNQCKYENLETYLDATVTEDGYLILDRTLLEYPAMFGYRNDFGTKIGYLIADASLNVDRDTCYLQIHNILRKYCERFREIILPSATDSERMYAAHANGLYHGYIDQQAYGMFIRDILEWLGLEEFLTNQEVGIVFSIL